MFIEQCLFLSLEKGKTAMITLPSWLTIGSYSSFRHTLINNYHIDSLLHMGRGIFGVDWGSVAFVINNSSKNKEGHYFRLHKKNFQHIYPHHIGQLFKKVLKDHTFKYDFTTYRDEEVATISEFPFEYSVDGTKLYYHFNQDKFNKLPNNSIGYWISDHLLRIFEQKKISTIGKPA